MSERTQPVPPGIGCVREHPAMEARAGYSDGPASYDSAAWTFVL